MEVIENDHRQIGVGGLGVLHQGTDLLDGGGKARGIEQRPHRPPVGPLAGGEGGDPALELGEVLAEDRPAPALQIVGGEERGGGAQGAAAVVGHQAGADGAAAQFAGEKEHAGTVDGQAHGGGDSHGGLADARAGSEHVGALSLAREDAAAHVEIEGGDAGGDGPGALLQWDRRHLQAVLAGVGGGENGLDVAQAAGGDGDGLVDGAAAVVQFALDRQVLPQPGGVAAQRPREEMAGAGALEQIAGDGEVEGGGAMGPAEQVGDGGLGLLEAAAPATGDGPLAQVTAQGIGVEHQHIALAEEDRIELRGDPAELLVAPEPLGHALVEAQAEAAAEDPPELTPILRTLQDNGEQVALVLQQLRRRGIDAIQRITHREGPAAGGDPVAAEDELIEEVRIEAAREGFWSGIRSRLRGRVRSRCGVRSWSSRGLALCGGKDVSGRVPLCRSALVARLPGW